MQIQRKQSIGEAFKRMLGKTDSQTDKNKDKFNFKYIMIIIKTNIKTENTVKIKHDALSHILRRQAR